MSIASQNGVLTIGATAALDVIEAQNKEIENLKRKCAAMENAAGFLGRYAMAVHLHNMKCDAECDKGYSCGWEGMLRRQGRRCAACPVQFKVDPMPHDGSA